MFKKHNIVLWLVFLFLPINYTLHASLFPQQELHWDWSDVDLSDELYTTFQFPHDFLWGVATSACQIEGTQSAHGRYCKNNWTERAQHNPMGIACDHWNRYKEDIQLIKNAGMNAYRFSLEWSKIEPEKGVFDHEAMQHYVDLVDELIKNDIKPIVCLFHHTWPVWFDAQDAFEKKENIPDFVEYCLYVFKHLHNKVDRWMTFNEPEGYCLEGYFRGTYPPYKKSLKLAGVVLNTMMNAHVAVYKEFKTINSAVQIGYPKIYNPLDPYNPLNPLEQGASQFFDYLMHEVTSNFFKTGHFNWAFMVTDYNADAPKCLDYLGLNYYSHTIVRQTTWSRIEVAIRPGTLVGDGGRAIYPEGLYRSIQRVSQLRIPFHIAENGVPDNDDVLKNDYIKKHLYVINLALQEGYDIQGYFWWTLMDSYGWHGEIKNKHGLYSCDQTTFERILKDGAKPFIQFVRSMVK